jgi:HEAT repeat protein
MRCRNLCLAVGLIFLAADSSRADEQDDPIISGTKLSKLVEAFKSAKTADKRSNLALAIADGKAKAVSAVPVLAAALKDKESVVRMNIAQALGTMGPSAKAAVPDLIAALKDTDRLVRQFVAVALGQIGPEAKAAVPALSDILKDASRESALRSCAARALGGIAAKEAVPLLTDALRAKEGRVRVSSAEALFTIDKGNVKVAVPVLREALKDKDAFAQTGAVMALGSIGAEAKDAVPDLLALLVKGGMAGYYAREALGKIPAAESALVAALKDPDKKLVEAAAGVLKEYYPAAAKKAGLVK